MIFVLLGISGCGKSTQASILSERFKLSHISTGKIFRREYEAKTKLGVDAYERYWSKGNWVPTPIAFRLLQPELDRLGLDGFVLEGWPRVVGQAEILDDYLKDKQKKVLKVIYLKTEKEVALSRLSKRAAKELEKTGKKRLDDADIEVINQRFISFERSARPIIDYYSAQNKLIEVDNSGEIFEVSADLFRKLEMAGIYGK